MNSELYYKLTLMNLYLGALVVTVCGEDIAKKCLDIAIESTEVWRKEENDRCL